MNINTKTPMDKKLSKAEALTDLLTEQGITVIDIWFTGLEGWFLETVDPDPEFSDQSIAANRTMNPYVFLGRDFKRASINIQNYTTEPPLPLT